MEQKMVNLKINDIPVTVPEGTTVLEAARSAGFMIPSLCFLKDVNEIGSCRICVVEVKGARSLMASCVYPVSEGMEVQTNTPKVRHSRQLSLELILSNHRMDCLTCARNAHCELRDLAADLQIDAVRYANDLMVPQIEASALHLVRDNSKCILCRRCTAACRKQQAVPGRLPHRRPQRAGLHPRGDGRPPRPHQARGGGPRPLRPRHPGRVLRHARGHQCGGQNGVRPAPSGL